jgi:hypothetical protein
MNRILLAVGTMLLFALAVVAQQPAAKPDSGAPTVEGHLKVLTEKLDLSGDQQAKTKPILQEMQYATQKLMQDESMSRDERMDKVKACRYKADREVRKILNDDQKKKLDQLEEEPYPEPHGK